MSTAKAQADATRAHARSDFDNAESAAKAMKR